MIIYKTTNTINGKIYVGKSKNNKPSYFGSGIVINFALKKYGRNNFKKEILEECHSIEELNKQENFWILKLESFKPEIGYNRSFGGDGFSGITAETIEKIRTKNLGKKRTDEQKQHISLSLKDKPKTEEHKQSLSVAWEKRKIEKPYTDETKEKMRKSMLGKNIGKYIKNYEFKGPDGLIYNTEKGFVKFSKEHHIHPGSFRLLIQGKIQEYHGWTYIQTINI
jgi:group I intron endonuclease